MLACFVVALSLASDVGVVVIADGQHGEARAVLNADVLGLVEVYDSDVKRRVDPVTLVAGVGDGYLGVELVLARLDSATRAVAPNARAVELVQRGEELLLSFDHARAAAVLGEAAALLEPTLSDVDFDTWTRARTLAGVAWMESGNADAAKDAFTRLLALHPDVVPDASLLSPAARVVFDAARADVSARGTGTLEVRTGGVDGARIIVDGRPRGAAPLSIAGLVAGTHRILVSMAGYESTSADVRIDADAIVPHDVTLAPTRQRRTLESLTPDAVPSTVLPELRAIIAAAKLEALLIVHVDSDVVRVRCVTLNDSRPRGAHVAREPVATLGARLRTALASSATEPGGASAIDFDATLLGRPRAPDVAVVPPPVDEGSDWLLIGAVGGGSVLVVAAAVVAVVALWPQPVPERTLVVALELPAP